MFLIFVLRYKYIGADTIGYVKFFETEVRDYSFRALLRQDEMRTEIGYRLYVKVISLFTSNYTIYFLINALIIFGTLYHFVKKHTDNPFIFFFLSPPATPQTPIPLLLTAATVPATWVP